MNIRTKFTVGLAGILIINLAAGICALFLYRQEVHREILVRERSTQIITTALKAQVDFKKQVQEWKDILLRGDDPDLYRRYFGQFVTEEKHTRETTQVLIALLTSEGDRELLDTARHFLSAHEQLGAQYRSALEHFDQNTAAPHRSVDRLVQGIDREPTDLIDRLVSLTLVYEQQHLEQINLKIRHLEFEIFFAMITIMSGAVLFLIWLFDRSIGLPIATVTAIAQRVSQGDFSTDITVHGTDERARMLKALLRMQENLAESRTQVERSEARLRLLLESTGEGIYGVDGSGNCVFCNPAGARMLGYDSPQELKGRNMHETIHYARADGNPLPLSQCQCAVTWRAGQTAHVDDEVFWRADGTYFFVEYDANPIYLDDRLMGAVVTFSDITDRKRSEQELRIAHQSLAEERAQLAERVRERTEELDRANAELARTAQAKDEFLAAMSHELRTPLTSILGLTETIGDGLLGPLTAQQQKAMRMIGENGTHLLELINDILDMSRVASGQMTLRPDQIPVEQLWDSTLRMIAPAARRKDLEVEAEIDPGVRLIQGDSRRLKQMLLNLLGNAVKFTPEGGHIGLGITGVPADREVIISIWDTGVGIPSDQYERLFQPFVQLDSRPSRQYDGTGLGLALAAGMAKLHHGRIEVNSEVGKGSRFDIHLPWDPGAQENVRKEQDLPTDDGHGESSATTRETARVLLVEDNQSNLQMIASYLRIRGYEVLTASSGAAALTIAERTPPDIVLMDVQMPEMDGLEATRRLRRQPAMRVTPIIALTALAMPGDRELCLEAGMDDYLSKPLGLKELYTTIGSWLKRTQPRKPVVAPAPQPEPSDKSGSENAQAQPGATARQG